jgi:hypothetical protein
LQQWCLVASIPPLTCHQSTCLQNSKVKIYYKAVSGHKYQTYQQEEIESIHISPK